MVRYYTFSFKSVVPDADTEGTGLKFQGSRFLEKSFVRSGTHAAPDSSWVLQAVSIGPCEIRLFPTYIQASCIIPIVSIVVRFVGLT